ncbi:MAG: hypothetical protein HN509_01290 [Halobacteriovoraceae bacterium]|jgi:chemotaxis protein histidine kinase CheA|nr:hypothetical protein [Halobacteriovoraceae bacterium]MBT5093844.1 hypothetical protein [Halobacteriovoraceae bacterium]
MDKEFIEAFVEESLEIKVQACDVVISLEEDLNQPAQFERYAQLIDRIYGAAMTLGFKFLGDYSKVLKDICLKVAKVESPNARDTVLKMMKRYLQTLDLVLKDIEEPSKMMEIKKMLELESKKAHNLEDKVFQWIKKKKAS